MTSPPAPLSPNLPLPLRSRPTTLGEGEKACQNDKGRDA